MVWERDAIDAGGSMDLGEGGRGKGEGASCSRVAPRSTSGEPLTLEWLNGLVSS
jgi:hypothetical protein